MELPFPKKDWGTDWNQIKNLQPKDLISIMKKDSRWEFIGVSGARYLYRRADIPKPHDIIAIHYHNKGYRDKGLLKDILNHTCWTKEMLRAWKVIK
jgi:hypothetical protein